MVHKVHPEILKISEFIVCQHPDLGSLKLLTRAGGWADGDPPPEILRVGVENFGPLELQISLGKQVFAPKMQVWSTAI